MAFPYFFFARLYNYERFIDSDFGMMMAKLTFLIPVLFVAVLFLQSGIDKVMDRKGNLDWLKGHFAKSPLKNMVPLLLTFVTFLELLTGCAALLGAVLYPFVQEAGPLVFFAFMLSNFTLLVLFSGQRIAKDYAGAAGIVPYFFFSVFMSCVTILII